MSPGQPAQAFREVASPLSLDALEALPDDCVGIAFSGPLTDEEYRKIAGLLERHPDKKMYASQLDSTCEIHITDLGFLRFFSNLRRFSMRLPWLESLEGIEHLRGADELLIFKMQRRLSAAPLAQLRNLDYLWLDGQYSERGALRDMTGLTNFKMGYAAKIPDLSFLPPNLTRFSMNLGSVTDISALADLPYLNDLSFHKVHSIADLSPLAGVTGLR